MSAALGWLLLAAAATVAPAAPAPRGDRPLRPHRALSRRVLQLLAAGSVGAACLVVLGVTRGAVAGGVAAPVTVWLVARLDAKRAHSPPDRSLALTLDLVAAALRGGQPVPAALVLAAPTSGHSTAVILSRVAGLLRLGAEPTEAWRPAADDPTLATLAQVARRSSTSGIRLAGGLEQLAVDLRAELGAAAEARAQRAGVLAVAPLGFCFLPAFVCLGVIPVVVGIATGVFGGVP